MSDLRAYHAWNIGRHGFPPPRTRCRRNRGRASTTRWSAP
jgi:hypothetical protein